MLPLFQTAGISHPVLYREGMHHCFYAVGGSGLVSFNNKSLQIGENHCYNV